MQKIKLFVPEKTSDRRLSFKLFSEYVGKDVYFSMKGRYSIKQIVGRLLENSSGNRRGCILPAYCCESVYNSLKSLNLNFYFADIDEWDLNISVESVRKILKTDKEKILCVIVPSLYGNPADLVSLERICINAGVAMIDDAAQAWGCSLDDRTVGTFGTAGVWACSPGKPTGGAFGSVFWMDNYRGNDNAPCHLIMHKLLYDCYLKTRCNVYEGRILSNCIGKIERLIVRCLYKVIDIECDGYSAFDENKLGGYFWDSLSFVAERHNYLNYFVDTYGAHKMFRIITNIRGSSHPCKIILVFSDENVCKKAKAFMKMNGICYGNGYEHVCKDFSGLKTTKKIQGHVLELPIELNKKHMSYIQSVLDEFIKLEEKND